jgi:hypothetical protein
MKIFLVVLCVVIGLPLLNWLTSGAVEAILNHWRHKKP